MRRPTLSINGAIKPEQIDILGLAIIIMILKKFDFFFLFQYRLSNQMVPCWPKKKKKNCENQMIPWELKKAKTTE